MYEDEMEPSPLVTVGWSTLIIEWLWCKLRTSQAPMAQYRHLILYEASVKLFL